MFFVSISCGLFWDCDNDDNYNDDNNNNSIIILRRGFCFQASSMGVQWSERGSLLGVWLGRKRTVASWKNISGGISQSTQGIIRIFKQLQSEILQCYWCSVSYYSLPWWRFVLWINIFGYSYLIYLNTYLVPRLFCGVVSSLLSNLILIKYI